MEDEIPPPVRTSAETTPTHQATPSNDTGHTEHPQAHPLVAGPTQPVTVNVTAPAPAPAPAHASSGQ